MRSIAQNYAVALVVVYACAAVAQVVELSCDSTLMDVPAA